MLSKTTWLTTVDHQLPGNLTAGNPVPEFEDKKLRQHLNWNHIDEMAEKMAYLHPVSTGSEVKWSEVNLLSCVQLFATPWTVAHQAPPSMGFSRQESWSGLPFPSPGDLPDPGIEPRSPALEADALTSEPPGKPQSHSLELSLDLILPFPYLRT